MEAVTGHAWGCKLWGALTLALMSTKARETENGNKQKGNSPAEVRELIASVDGKAGAQLLQR